MGSSLSIFRTSFYIAEKPIVLEIRWSEAVVEHTQCSLTWETPAFDFSELHQKYCTLSFLLG